VTSRSHQAALVTGQHASKDRHRRRVFQTVFFDGLMCSK
jgi:hypothetical protein